MKPTKILVPTDFSLCATNALRAAIYLGRRTGASLTIFHAIESAVYNEAAEAFFDADRDDKEKAAAAFEKLQKEMPELKDVTYETVTNYGSVPGEVASLAGSINADLVVMGTMGASGINEVLIGSNAYNVMKSLEIPVLVVPNNYEIDEITSIVLAGDYKPIDPALLNPVKMMAELKGADIHIVHIADDQHLGEEEMMEARKINRHLKDYHHHYHLIENDDIETGLQDYCDKNHIDLLAMIPRKHNLFDRIFDGGETKNMLFHAKIPLLAIPENYH
jgi:nucleotide-binding universal stress UspA family protein